MTISKNGKLVAPMPPGPKTIAITELGPKLEALLLAHGRLHTWLASVLDTSAPAIAGWKATGQMPFNRLMALCAIFELDRTFLIGSDLPAFQAYLERFQALGSGQRWRALLNACAESTPGLGFLATQPLEPPRRLRGVKPDRLDPTRSTRPTPIEIHCSEKPTFELDPESLPQTHRWSAQNLVLILEDPERTQCLCPSSHRGGFVNIKGRWRFPAPDSKPFEFDQLIGPHRAIAIAFREELPIGIRDELLSDALMGARAHLWPALDRLALWLRGTAHQDASSTADPPQPHAVRAFRFLLLPDRPNAR